MMGFDRDGNSFFEKRHGPIMLGVMRWGKNWELGLQKPGKRVVSGEFQAVLDAQDQVSGNCCARPCMMSSKSREKFQAQVLWFKGLGANKNKI